MTTTIRLLFFSFFIGAKEVPFNFEQSQKITKKRSFKDERNVKRQQLIKTAERVKKGKEPASSLDDSAKELTEICKKEHEQSLYPSGVAVLVTYSRRFRAASYAVVGIISIGFYEFLKSLLR